ncbi:hypothetical protein J2W46_005421, partial [Paraburkholderia strydomiana]|nr:hypothetical protein [Paraburkholderia strydomiana]
MRWRRKRRGGFDCGGEAVRGRPAQGLRRVNLPPRKRRNPTFCGVGFLMLLGSLTITYFHTGNPHY